MEGGCGMWVVGVVYEEGDRWKVGVVCGWWVRYVRKGLGVVCGWWVDCRGGGGGDMYLISLMANTLAMWFCS